MAQLHTLIAAIALVGCSSRAPAPMPSAPATPPDEVVAVQEPELFGIWLLGQSSWQGTLYGVRPHGLSETESITSNAALWTEPVGTLHWLEGCDSVGAVYDEETVQNKRSSCEVVHTCPFAGRLILAPSTVPTTSCDTFRLTVVSTCSDGKERPLRATFDGACEEGATPTAHIYVDGEPGTDGRLPGWDSIMAARYRLCATSESCRAEVALVPGAESLATFAELARSSTSRSSNKRPVLLTSSSN